VATGVGGVGTIFRAPLTAVLASSPLATPACVDVAGRSEPLKERLSDASTAGRLCCSTRRKVLLPELSCRKLPESLLPGPALRSETSSEPDKNEGEGSGAACG
jgi:hypothetical protein